MKTGFMVFFVTVLAMLAVLPLVSAAVVSIDNVEVDGMDVSTGNVAVEAGEIVALKVEYTAGVDAGEAEITAWFSGYRSEAVGKILPDLIVGKEYNARLSLAIPKDLDETEEDLTLVVEIETDEGNERAEYTLNVQRKPYNADLLFIEVDDTVEAGEAVAVDVVAKNLGRHELDDLVVKVSIPELGISKRVYFGDLTPTDDEDEFGEDAEDAAKGTLYLKVPANAETGAYELVVEASNSDTSSIVTKILVVVGAEETSKVLVPVTSKELSTGEVKTYDVIIVNSGDKIGIYELVPETAEGVIVSVKEPVVTVKAGESKVVQVEVKAGNRDGTYSFAVDVNSGGKLVGKATLNASVVKGRVVGKSNLTILTVILAIIFVVLLIVLIVLLTRKPERAAEELEESYY